MNEKKKKRFIIGSIIVITLSIAFGIYWLATKHERHVKKSIDTFSEQMSVCRNEGIGWPDFDFIDSELDDPIFIDFLSAQVKDMFENGEYTFIPWLFKELARENIKNSELRSVLIDSFQNLKDLEAAFEMVWRFDNVEYYRYKIKLTRDSTPIVSYIESNGTEKITTTPGKGYYADEEDRDYFQRVGLSTSPLYKASKTTYLGDFKKVYAYGRKLNSYYEETSYSETTYYFRGIEIDFTPNDGEFVLSGDYLFCFYPNGTFDYTRIK